MVLSHGQIVWQVEEVMMAFVESSARQHNLPAMIKRQREAAHEMAQAFALTTQSFGQEPNRYVRLLKVALPESYSFCCGSSTLHVLYGVAKYVGNPTAQEDQHSLRSLV